jgi:hypothetical protein
MSYVNPPPPQPPGAPRRPSPTPAWGGFGPEEFELAPEDFGERDDYDETGWRPKFRSVMAAVLTRAGWLALAALLALGSAGIVAATDQPPGNGIRPELTYDADKALSARLDAAVRDLATLDDDVVTLGDQARVLLADLSEVNAVGLETAYGKGDRSVMEIQAGAAGLDTRLECGAWTSAREADLARTYDRTLIDRWRQVCVSLGSVSPLADDWAAMKNGAQVAMQVVDDINGHDSTAANALQLATQGRYPEALATLHNASVSLAGAQRIATSLATVADVSTLNEWLKRTADMDAALALLWQTMIDSNGRVTPQVTAALKGVTDAKALLPDNTGIVQIVLYELAGNLTSHGISIETAKGQLAAALAGLTGGSVLPQ